MQVLGLSEVERAALLAVRDRHAAKGAGGARRMRPATALLAPLTSFVGRERELGEIRRLLGGARLLTLTGTGGIGNTRLALQVASTVEPSFADGTVGVDLASLQVEALVPEAVAAMLGVPESPGLPLLSALVDELRPKQLLLVLDNCEHLLGACAELADHLLRVCPGLTILATSREPLGIAGEVAWRVPALPTPEPSGDISIEEFMQYEAVQLFVERAGLVLPGFALAEQTATAVTEICRRLDGVPLAIELAAARVRILAPAQIAERLDDRFGLLTGGSRTAPPRQQTLRAAIEWSYDLLEPVEQLLFDRLSVFVGGWTLEAAEAINHVNTLDVLTRLVDKSMVLAEPGAGGVMRYRLLEALRQYSQERLRDREHAEETHRRHALFFLELGERAGRRRPGEEQPSWLASMAPELDNFRAALAWSTGRVAEAISQQLAAAPAEILQRQAYAGDSWGWLLRALERGDDGSAAAARAAALRAAAFLAYSRSDHEAAHANFSESLALWQQVGDEHGAADALRGLGMIALELGETDRAEALLLESRTRFRASPDSWGSAACLCQLGELAHVRRDLSQAVALFGESLALAREQGDTWQTAYVLHSLGHLAWDGGSDARATALLGESLALSRGLQDRRGISSCLGSLALVAGRQRRFGRAAHLFGAAAGLREAVGVHRRAWLRRDDEQGVAAARAALGEAAFAAEYAAGRAMSLDEAIGYALADDDPAIGPDRHTFHSARGAGDLTPREHEVAALVARGLTNRQIAEELVIAEGTAANHVKHILARLGLDSRVQIAAWVTERAAQRTPAT
ncbi:MAG TPA: tetratricopeptide repeat protein [Chloroflexota bacterium]|nr:tetratricopeptide repeat protein [Chloroflexota bacterium]